MQNWQIIDSKKHNVLWDYVLNVLQFKPNASKEGVIKLPHPSKKFNVAPFFDAGFSRELYTDLHSKTKTVLETIAKDEQIYALDWQHDAYEFDPGLAFELNESGEWLIPVFPNGDLIFFLTTDFKNVIFGDGIHLEISISGEQIFRAFESEKPRIFK